MAEEENKDVLAETKEILLKSIKDIGDKNKVIEQQKKDIRDLTDVLETTEEKATSLIKKNSELNENYSNLLKEKKDLEHELKKLHEKNYEVAAELGKCKDMNDKCRGIEEKVKRSEREIKEMDEKIKKKDEELISSKKLYHEYKDKTDKEIAVKDKMIGKKKPGSWKKSILAAAIIVGLTALNVVQYNDLRKAELKQKELETKLEKYGKTSDEKEKYEARITEYIDTIDVLKRAYNTKKEISDRYQPICYPIINNCFEAVTKSNNTKISKKVRRDALKIFGELRDGKYKKASQDYKKFEEDYIKK